MAHLTTEARPTAADAYGHAADLAAAISAVPSAADGPRGPRFVRYEYVTSLAAELRALAEQARAVDQ
jgi:hypothetical protein